MTYHAYCGIGSRDTPAYILNIMSHIGSYLAHEGWTLRSGGADGADLAFEKAADTVASNTMTNGQDRSLFKEIYLPWKNFNHSTSDLHPEKIPFSEQEISVAAQAHPVWHRCSPAARKMHTRNVRQILGCQAVNGDIVIPVGFVVCWTLYGQLKGGTAQALRIAQACEIKIFNLGSPTSPQELEAMILDIDSFQKQIKEGN